MGIRDRLRRLEHGFQDRGPALGDVSVAFARIAENARAKLYGTPVDEEQNQRDRDIIVRWERAWGVDLEAEAERAKQTLLDMRSDPAPN